MTETQIMGTPTKYRDFEGKRFVTESVGNREAYSRGLAKRLRSNGHHARVVKVGNFWVVYKREK